MIVTNLTVSFDDATFAPIYEVTLSIPLEFLQDGMMYMPTEDFHQIVGESLLTQLSAFRANQIASE